MTDNQIWNYSLDKNLIILTKDADFFNKVLISETSPKIIYFQIRNLSLKELFFYFDKNWETIISEIKNCQIIIAKNNFIECIG